ncbi:helix-turn-helix transcriptional regulator [Miniphocaeibacter halophilus]|uniref:Helix-turn-helix transcriptional regulator n=1 Tax=Miniphocaeibacter halophilus TaxID=2931922 RepID=A0AC61MTD5_9FIRM|nr:helix-turn-helix transcriptional regulator [Miniphocaeibacter halophilus]QQK08965.1 helix-turn-helix transcriptional regulator [Miniphocaeibacter halophilus]
MEIGKSLKEKRTELNLTQEEVAKEIMVSRQTISNWENGKSYPDIENLVLLSQLYNISLDGLLKNNIEETKKLQESMEDEVRRSTTFSNLIIFSVLAMAVLITGLIGGKDNMIDFLDYFSEIFVIIVIIGSMVLSGQLKKDSIQLTKKANKILKVIVISAMISIVTSMPSIVRSFNEGYKKGVQWDPIISSENSNIKVSSIKPSLFF